MQIKRMENVKFLYNYSFTVEGSLLDSLTSSRSDISGGAEYSECYFMSFVSIVVVLREKKSFLKGEIGDTLRAL